MTGASARSARFSCRIRRAGAGPASLLAAVLLACTDSAPSPLESAVVAAAPSAERTSFLAGVRQMVADEDWESAQQALAAWIESAGEDGEALTLLSLVARMRGDTSAAVDWGERATLAAPESSEAHLQYSRALGEKMRSAGALGALSSLGDFKDALQRARELDPSNLEARNDEIAFHLIAPGIAGGSQSKGLELARELVALDRARGLPLLVWALSANDEPEEAIETARAALEQEPGNRALRLSLARLYAEEKRLDEALALWEEVLQGERDRTYYDALYQMARALVLAEREPERAIEALQRYIEGAPVAPELPPKAGAWWRIGLAHELRGDTAAARAAYESALALDPDFEQAQDALDELD